MTTFSHDDLIRDAFRDLPRVDRHGRRTVAVTEAELHRRVAVLLSAVQRITARQALLHLKRVVAHAN